MTESDRVTIDALKAENLQLRARLRRHGWPARLRRWVTALGILLVLLLAAYLARHWLLTRYALAFRLDNPASCDAIVLLLGAAEYRPDRAADLFREGLAPVVLICGTETSSDRQFNQTEQNRQGLLGAGVPPEAIRVLPGAVTSTRDEAESIRDLLQAEPPSTRPRRITLVTTAFHTVRARWIFRKTLADAGLDVDVRAVSADHPRFTERDWYRTEEGLVSYVNETVKTLFYRLRY